MSINKEQLVSINVTEAVEQFYPKLTPDQIESIALDIKNKWDYAAIYTQIKEHIEEYCCFAKIDLNGKDGIYSGD